MRVAVAQLPARDLQDRDLALDDVVGVIGDAGEAGAQLVVLPECSWPAYILGTDRTAWWSLEEQRRAQVLIADATRQANLVSVVGLALQDGPRVLNAAVVVEPDGKVAGQVAKRFLWDVDRLWFDAAADSAPIDTAIGRLGVFVCADGRMPEIARQLSDAGAQLLVDPTAWVTAGDDPATWTNPQHEFMFATRGWEHRRPAIAANKVGYEQGMVAYCGRSMVVGADGERLAVARSDGPELLLAEVDLAETGRPSRRPRGHDQVLGTPTEHLPASRRRREPLTMPSRPRLAVPARALSLREANLLDDLRPALVVSAAALPGSAEPPIWPVVWWDPAQASVRVRAGAQQRELPVDDVSGVRRLELGETSAAVLLGDELDGPEPARAAMLQGADLLIWFGSRELPEVVLRTRAAENRVYLVAVDPSDSVPWARIVDPEGAVRGRSTGARPVATASLALADARAKEMAPGTDVVAGRQPSTHASVP